MKKRNKKMKESKEKNIRISRMNIKDKTQQKRIAERFFLMEGKRKVKVKIKR